MAHVLPRPCFFFPLVTVAYYHALLQGDTFHGDVLPGGVQRQQVIQVSLPPRVTHQQLSYMPFLAPRPIHARPASLLPADADQVCVKLPRSASYPDVPSPLPRPCHSLVYFFNVTVAHFFALLQGGTHFTVMLCQGSAKTAGE